VTVSLFTRQSDEETSQAIVFVDSYSPLAITRRRHRASSVGEIEDILGQYIGPAGGARDRVGLSPAPHLEREGLTNDWLVRLREEAERVLSGALGSTVSTLVFQDKSDLTHDEKLQVSKSIRQISRSLQLSRQELPMRTAACPAQGVQARTSSRAFRSASPRSTSRFASRTGTAPWR